MEGSKNGAQKLGYKVYGLPVIKAAGPSVVEYQIWPTSVYKYLAKNVPDL